MPVQGDQRVTRSNWGLEGQPYERFSPLEQAVRRRLLRDRLEEVSLERLHVSKSHPTLPGGNIHKVSFLTALQFTASLCSLILGSSCFFSPVGRFLSDLFVWGLPFIQAVLCSVRNEVFGT